MVIDIPTSCQPVRVFPSNSKDTTTQSPRSEVALYTLVDISYEYGMVSEDDKHTFYWTVPGGVLDAVQTCIDKICSGIRYIPSYHTNSIHNHYVYYRCPQATPSVSACNIEKLGVA